MSNLALVAVMAATVFGIRFTGLMADRFQIPEMLELALRFAPVAVLSSVAAASLAGQVSDDPIRLAAAAGAGLIVLRTGRMWICILGGLGLYWCLRLVSGF